MQNDMDSSSDVSLRQYRIFAFHDRFAPSLSRFLHKTLEIDSEVSLVSIESGCRSVDSDSVLFCAGKENPAAAIVMPRSFILGVIDCCLGNVTFTPSDKTDTWSELDQELSFPFISRLFEILLGFCAPSSASRFGAVSVLSEDFSPDGEWYTVNWNITCCNKEFPFSFLLPADVAFGEETFYPTEPIASQTDEDLLHYIEMRRATSEKARDTESFSSSLFSADTITRIRILVGSFDLDRDNFCEMKPGDILTTDISADTLFTLTVGEKPFCHVRPGEDNGQKAVLIEEIS